MIKFDKFVLDNQLTVIHHHDDTTPFVVVNTLYNIGAKHEKEDRTGFAHLFEHLMLILRLLYSYFRARKLNFSSDY